MRPRPVVSLRGHWLAVVLVFIASSASATALRFQITGTVDQADANGVFAFGEAVDLVLDLDLALPLVQPWAFNSVASATGFGTADGDALTVTSGALTEWQISRGFGFLLAATGPTSGNAAFDAIEFSPGVFDGAGLAEFLALDASDVTRLRLRVRETVGSQSFLTRANVDVTGFSVVPEPGTAGLLVLGLFGLASVRLRPAT